MLEGNISVAFMVASAREDPESEIHSRDTLLLPGNQ